MNGDAIRLPPPGGDAIRVVVAERQPVVRASLCALLQRRGIFEVAADAGDLDTAAAALREAGPAILLLDLLLPGALLPRTLARLAELGAVIALTEGGSPPEARQVIASGASGYVLKTSPPLYLEEAVVAAARGRSYVDPQMGALLAEQPVEPTTANPDGLTAREVEILRLVVFGNTSKEIAQQLFLSVRTVETHRARIRRKLSIRRRADLVRYAAEHGFLSLI